MPTDLPKLSFPAVLPGAACTRLPLPAAPRARLLRSLRPRLVLWASLLFVLGSALGTAAPAAAQTLKAVRERGELVCGVSRGLLGFSSVDEKGNWSGFDVDLCRAEIRRYRRALAQFDVDDVARDFVRADLRGDHLLRWTRVSGPQDAQCRVRARSRRKVVLLADRNDRRAQCRRLFPCQQHDLFAGRVRQSGRDPQGL